MEEKLVALIAHLVYSGLEVERALEMGHLYATGHYLQALSFVPVFPREAEHVKNKAQAAADEAITKAIPKAWIETERLRKEDEPPRKHYTQDDVMEILKPFVLNDMERGMYV